MMPREVSGMGVVLYFHQLTAERLENVTNDVGFYKLKKIQIKLSVSCVSQMKDALD